jgi:subtilisin family serine protease
MGKRINIVIALMLLISLGFVASPVQAATSKGASNSKSIPNEYIVVLKSTNTPSTVSVSAMVDSLSSRYSLTPRYTYTSAFKGFAAKVPSSKLTSLLTDSSVAYILQDKTISLNDIMAPAPKKPNVDVEVQSVPPGIKRIGANLSSQKAGDGQGDIDNVAVAVIDTGIQSNHPDLNVVGGYNCVSTKRSAWSDGNGHGTHVAGTIGAKDDGIGVVGVAPGVPLYAVRVLDNNGSGSTSSVMCGIDWVTRNANTVSPRIVAANMSLGGPGSSDTNCGKTNNDPQHTAICNLVAAGVTLVVAAGNESDDAAHSVPASYSEVITVSAIADYDGIPGGKGRATCRTDKDDSFATFSNYGAPVDIAAPGVCILSTWMGGGYNTISGTSMASPHVAGAVALYMSTHLTATPAQVRTALLSAGATNWLSSSDPDNTNEKLLNVSTF